jgi:hypothetical protein
MSRILLSVLLLALASTSLAQAPANDECANATVITVSTNSTCNNSVFATTLDATQSLAPCAGTTAEDVWFQFTATDVSQVIKLSPSGLLLGVVEVFSGSCGSLTSIGCFSAHVNDLEFRRAVSGLTIGNTYFIRVYANYPDGGAFSLCIFPPSPNDECTGAIDIPLNTGLDWTSYTTGNNHNNSATGTGCLTNNLADGWFRFTAQDTVQLIHMTAPNAISSANTFVQVYSGSCGSLTLMQGMRYDGFSADCFYPGRSDGYYTLRGLTPGNTYFIKVVQNMYLTAASTTDFNIAIGNVPANDGFTGAQDITVNAGTDCVSKTTGNFRNASPTAGITHNCTNIYGIDLWYKFTATAARHIIAANFYNTVQNPGYQIYYLDAGILQPLVCGSGSDPYSFNDLTSLTPGTVYYIRVNAQATYFTDRFFDFCITTPGATAANDDCAAAPTIPLNQEILSGIRGSTFTTGMFTGCNTTGTAPRDVWYTFTPAANTSAVLQFVLPGANTGMGIEVHTGSCGTLTRIACSNAASHITDLHFTANAGITHYVRIYEFGAGSSNVPFLLSFTQFAPLPVTITAFKAAYTTNGSVKLTWNTEEESRINYYDVERSSNGIQFNQVTRVNARNVAAPSEYVAEDLSPAAGISYYRLKIVDVDGKVEYSKTVKMDTDGSFTGNLKVSRQGNFIQIHNNNADFKNVTLNIFTATGQKIYSAPKRLTAGVNSIAVPGKVDQPLFIQLVTDDNVARTFKVF